MIRNTTFDVEDNLEITKFISSNTHMFFEILGDKNPVFFLLHPSEWKNNETFQKMFGIVKNLTVVNDPAERAVGLVKNLNKTLTMDHVIKN